MSLLSSFCLFLSSILPCIVSSLEKPHILFIIMDDQGYNDIGYTYPELDKDLDTPLIDSLAHEGLILDRFYTMSLCTPARASLMTGRYPAALGIQSEIFDMNTRDCLREEEILLPELIRANGYATHLIGKWHLGYSRWECMPCLRGFDTAYGYTQGTITYYGHQKSGYHDFYSCSHEEEDTSVSILNGTNGVYSMELFGKRADEILEAHDPEQPLFLYMPFQTVHMVCEAPDYFYRESCSDVNDARCTMQAMLNAAEDTMNRTIGKFKDKGMWNNTLLVYMSDNGGPDNTYYSNSPLRGFKASLWEGGIRTPSFLYSASQDILAVRGRTACYVHVSDWFSTLVEFTGGWSAYLNGSGHLPPDNLDGIDQSALLLTGNTEQCLRMEIMVDIDPVKRVASFIRGDFKVLFGDIDSDAECEVEMYYPFNESCVDWSLVQLYNITQDVSEEFNLAGSYPDVVQQLQHALQLYLAEQEPLQCQLPTIEESYPSDDVPFCLPWDFEGGEIPSWATYALTDLGIF